MCGPSKAYLACRYLSNAFVKQSLQSSKIHSNMELVEVRQYWFLTTFLTLGNVKIIFDVEKERLGCLYFSDNFTDNCLGAQSLDFKVWY